MSQTEINMLETGLGFPPATSFINEKDLQRDFNEFTRKVICKSHFSNEALIRKEIPIFQSKSSWDLPRGSPALEFFSSKTKHNLFLVLPRTIQSD